VFDTIFACYIISIKLEKEYRDCAYWIINQAKPAGFLGMSVAEIAEASNHSEVVVLLTLKAMEATEPVALVRGEEGNFVFDYPPKAVSYVSHFVNALSNTREFLDNECLQEEVGNIGNTDL